MMRSMFSGVSGLRTHQVKMDVIGNNIANINTVGYKASRVTFQEIYNQTIKPASSPSDINNRGGVNPQQIGLGVSVGSIDVLHTRGGSQRTDKATDLAIEGDGFFMLSDNSGIYYTRAGNFTTDPLGYLTSATGLKVQGWSKDANGLINTKVQPKEINLSNLTMLPKATDKITFEGNLDAETDINDEIEYSVSIYDSLGNEQIIDIKLRRLSMGSPVSQWSISASKDSIPVSVTPNSSIFFNTEGRLSNAAGVPLTTEQNMTLNLNLINLNNGAVARPITFSLNNDKISQTAGETTVKAAEVNGYPSGILNNINIDSQGRIMGIYSNGQTEAIAILALARFDNPSGMLKLGDNLFTNSSNSGQPLIGLAGDGGLGTINPGALEMSNVDLAQEFTDMITAQRGFQANSRIINTTDEMLLELVNLRR